MMRSTLVACFLDQDRDESVRGISANIREFAISIRLGLCAGNEPLPDQLAPYPAWPVCSSCRSPVHGPIICLVMTASMAPNTACIQNIKQLTCEAKKQTKRDTAIWDQWILYLPLPRCPEGTLSMFVHSLFPQIMQTMKLEGKMKPNEPKNGCY